MFDIGVVFEDIRLLQAAAGATKVQLIGRGISESLVAVGARVAVDFHCQASTRAPEIVL